MTQDTSDALNIETPLTDTHPDSSQWDDSSTAQDEIENLKAEIANLREQLVRAQADYSNLVRRTREEQSQMGEWVENKTILKFLTILDNLERALEHTPEEFKSHAWTDGLISIVRAMQKTITDFGISRMDTVGKDVNPDLHDVISQIPHATTAIQAEVETGYMRNEKALRHAKVIVGDGSIV
jgi:molecular chaperone GrpE